MLVETSENNLMASGSLLTENIISGYAFTFGAAQVASWTAIDLSGDGVPASAHMAIVQLSLQTTTTPGTPPPDCFVVFRRPDDAAGSGNSRWFYYRPTDWDFVSGGSVYCCTAFIPLTDSEFEYQKANRLQVAGKIQGYLTETYSTS